MDASTMNRDPEEYHLRTYQVESKDKDITKLTWKQDMTLSEASFIIPSEILFSINFHKKNIFSFYFQLDKMLLVVL